MWVQSTHKVFEKSRWWINVLGFLLRFSKVLANRRDVTAWTWLSTSRRNNESSYFLLLKCVSENRGLIWYAFSWPELRSRSKLCGQDCLAIFKVNKQVCYNGTDYFAKVPSHRTGFGQPKNSQEPSSAWSFLSLTLSVLGMFDLTKGLFNSFYIWKRNCRSLTTESLF